jgi:hypothetical protein
MSGGGTSGTAHSSSRGPPLAGDGSRDALVEFHEDAAKLETAGAAGGTAAGSIGSSKGAEGRGTITSGGRSKLAPHWLPRGPGKGRMKVRRAKAKEEGGATSADGSASPTSRVSERRDGSATGSRLSFRRLLPFGGRSSG